MDGADDCITSGQSTWDINQTVPVLRPPRQCASTQPTPATSSDAALDGTDKGPKLSPFCLSADAKEFIPKSAQTFVPPATSEVSSGYYHTGKSAVHREPVYLPQQSQYPARKVSLQNRLTKFQNANGTDSDKQETNDTSYTQYNNGEPTDITHNVIRRLNEYMQEIIVKPGRFDALGRMLLDESFSWFGDSQIAPAVVDAIVSQAIIERNFQYNGARLCSLLSAELDVCDEPVFKNHLFERINAEYKKILPDVEKHPSKAYGFVGFLAELYSQMGIDGSSHNLGEYFLNIVDILVSSPTVESIKRVCQLLKLTGPLLDKENKPKMETVMEKLAKAGYKTNATHIVGSVINLRDQNWGGEVGEDAKEPEVDSSLSGLPCLQSEAVQYGPDGIALSKEESDFLHSSSNTPDEHAELEEADYFGDEYAPYDEDGMDEEMEKGFLEFLIESKQLI